ncbi:hypothetical protein DFQ27_007688 [Actinomortierella ambigua]|uniref:RlpA-like protein double-psi beta-barrel domain-containing protein n=1 Tax=Actinomortierella ambigua TaxID=1343610 RepID=A0A9P6TYT7_9FUNG|nr:hypothetical protein DFQ27_007688 [Actinomortierella ambigua]
MFLKTLFIPTLLAALALSASAAPVRTRARNPRLSTRINTLSASDARTTWFSDKTGSCRLPFDQSDMIVALNAKMMGDYSGPRSQCGRIMEVSYGEKKVEVAVVDTCPSEYCTRGAIDLSQAAFKKLAGLDKGVLETTWKLTNRMKTDWK